MSSADPELPTLDELGRDLVHTFPWRRWLTLARPIALLAVYALAFTGGYYWLTPLIVFFIFVAIVTAAHDLVHGALGMTRRDTDLWLFVTGAILLYALLVWSGSWVFPLLTVHLPHKDYGDTPLTQTRTLRGRVVPSIFLELTYHLEHHLYPQVPSHHLAELSRRLEPTLTSAGVVPWYVP